MKITEKVRKHLKKVGLCNNIYVTRNAIACVYSLLDDKEFMIDLILEKLYPIKEVQNGKAQKEQTKKTAK